MKQLYDSAPNRKNWYKLNIYIYVERERERERKYNTVQMYTILFAKCYHEKIRAECLFLWKVHVLYIFYNR